MARSRVMAWMAILTVACDDGGGAPAPTDVGGLDAAVVSDGSAVEDAAGHDVEPADADPPVDAGADAGRVEPGWGVPAEGAWAVEVFAPGLTGASLAVGPATQGEDGWVLSEVRVGTARVEDVAVRVEGEVGRVSFTLADLPAPVEGALRVDAAVHGPYYLCGTLTGADDVALPFAAIHADAALRAPVPCGEAVCRGTPWAARRCRVPCAQGACPAAHWCDADGRTSHAGCVPSAPCLDAEHPCAPGESCGLVDGVAACWPAGGGAVGAACDALDAPCEASLACVFGRCVERCPGDGACAAPDVCASLAALVIGRDVPTERPDADWCVTGCDPRAPACDAGEVCAARAEPGMVRLWRCGGEVDAPAIGAPCGPDAACGAGAVCAGPRGARRCRAACVLGEADGCAEGEACVPADQGPADWGGCAPACIVLAEGPACVDGEACVPAEDPVRWQGAWGRLPGECVPDEGLLAQGAVCGDEVGVCGPGLLCAHPCIGLCGGYGVGRPTTCTPLCGPGDARPCPGDLRCARVDDDPTALGRCGE